MQVLGGRGDGGDHGPPLIPGFSSTPVTASSPTITGGRTTWCACRARPGSAWLTSTWEWMCSPGGTSWAADLTPTRWVVALEAGVGAVASLRPPWLWAVYPRSPPGGDRHQETSVTCPGAKLGPGALAAAHLYGQMVRPLEVPGPCARSPLPPVGRFAGLSSQPPVTRGHQGHVTVPPFAGSSGLRTEAAPAIWEPL